MPVLPDETIAKAMGVPECASIVEWIYTNFNVRLACFCRRERPSACVTRINAKYSELLR